MSKLIVKLKNRKNLFMVFGYAVVLSAAVLIGTLIGKASPLAQAAGAAGSKTDPVITEKYLLEVFTPAIEAEVDKRVASAIAALPATIEEKVAQQLSVTPYPNSGESAPAMPIVELYIGQVLKLSAGTEFVLTGGAMAVSDGDLIDATNAKTIMAGSEVPRPALCIAGINGASVTVTNESVELIIRGDFALVG